MDPAEQAMVKRLAEEHGRERLVIILGSPNADSARAYAETVVTGDPAFAGPLAGVSLRLPVYHIFEDEVKSQVEPEVYQELVGVMELALDTDGIISAVRDARGGDPA